MLFLDHSLNKRFKGIILVISEFMTTVALTWLHICTFRVLNKTLAMVEDIHF